MVTFLGVTRAGEVKMLSSGLVLPPSQFELNSVRLHVLKRMERLAS